MISLGLNSFLCMVKCNAESTNVVHGYVSLAISNCDNLFRIRLDDTFFIYVKSVLAIRQVKGKAELIKNFLALLQIEGAKQNYFSHSRKDWLYLHTVDAFLQQFIALHAFFFARQEPVLLWSDRDYSSIFTNRNSSRATKDCKNIRFDRRPACDIDYIVAHRFKVAQFGKGCKMHHTSSIFSKGTINVNCEDLNCCCQGRS